MIKLVIFDRDGVVNELIANSIERRSPRQVSEVVVDANIMQLIRNLNVKGMHLAIASNQPEISRGLIDQEILSAINDRILELLEIDIKFYICLHDDVDECSCRKPKPGLLLQILEHHGILSSEAIFIGDRIIDALAAEAAGMKFLQYLGGSPGIFKYAINGQNVLLSGTGNVFDWILSQ